MNDETHKAENTFDDATVDTLLRTLESAPPADGAARASSPPPDDMAEAVGELLERYRDMGRIGRGGMGIVHRVYDQVLERTVAMKLLRPEIRESTTAVERFQREANITAGLQHPGIVPVYERGVLPGGVQWYTMREVQGQTLSSVLTGHATMTTPSGIVAGVRQLVELLARVCDAMTYAHARHVVHRDLKPTNILVGAFNDVLVVDWGLALRMDVPSDTTDVEELPELRISSSRHTVLGQVLGTPAYMAPEQALGDLERIGPHTDVYALGAMLYEILTGRPPRTGSARRVLTALRDGAPIERPERVVSRIPEAMPPELVELAMRALQADPDRRPADAAPIGAALRAWLDGSEGRARAREAVERARHDRARLADMDRQLGVLRTRALKYLERLPPTATADEKQPAWALEDQAEQFAIDLTIEEGNWLLGLQTALTHDPLSEGAHALLAEHYREKHAAAEMRGGTVEAAQLEMLLRTHDRGQHADYLRGWGHLDIATDPPGADVSLLAFVERGRRLRRIPRGSLGHTPLRRIPIARGSYLLVLRAPGCIDVRYPVLIDRNTHWDGIPPGGDEPLPIHLPSKADAPRDAVFVPAGWFWRGGDPDAADGVPLQRVWVEGFFIQRFPVIHADYLRFLDDLVARGRAAEAASCVPRFREGTDSAYEPLYRPDGGRYVLTDPTTQQPDHPVTYVDWHSAMTYAEWYAEATGQPWRLPDETEWAKAARGVDRRQLPWGNHWEPSWARTLDGCDTPSVERVGSHPIDESPYGVRGVAGNTCDWCINTWKAEGSTVRDDRLVVEPAAPSDGALRTGRGGIWAGSGRFARIATRFADPPDRRLSVLGLRLVCPWPKGA